MAGRFTCLVERQWGGLVKLWEEDKERVNMEGRQHRKPGTAEEKKDRIKRASIHLLSKGNTSKCMNLLTSDGLADLDDPQVRKQVQAKHPPRGQEIQETVVLKSPVSNLKGLRNSLKNLKRKKGSSPGAGGCRPEYLVTLGEVMQADRMEMFEDVCLLYLNSKLPPWFYQVFLTTRTVAPYKDNTHGPVWPIGVQHPLPRVLGSYVVQENKMELVSFLEPQQLALSRGGCSKLYTTLRMLVEEGPSRNVLVKYDKENAFNCCSRARAVKVYSKEPTLSHLASHAATTLAPTIALEDRGKVWGWGEEGYTQGAPRSSTDFCCSTQEYLVRLDTMVRQGGGQALALMDDGYVYGPPEVVFPAIKVFELEILSNCGLKLQRSKCEVLSWSGALPEGCPDGFKLAGDVIDGRFEPGLMCVGVPMGSDTWIKRKMMGKVEELGEEMEKVVSGG